MNSASHMALHSIHACSWNWLWVWMLRQHQAWHAHKRFICLNNPSPQLKVSYKNGIAPRASGCLLSPRHHRREQLLQWGDGWLCNVLPCTGNTAGIHPGQSRFTAAQVLPSRSCRLLRATAVFPRKPILVLTCTFVKSMTKQPRDWD